MQPATGEERSHRGGTGCRLAVQLGF
uniref:Uncharacterized protein n=1 Tax=Arundo donax TaxID=35708 RepID=A0A0A9ATW4_ARUDO